MNMKPRSCLPIFRFLNACLLFSVVFDRLELVWIMEWLFPIDVSPEVDLPIFDPSEESVDSVVAGIIPFMSSITP